jgi:hypothetical protein
LSGFYDPANPSADGYQVRLRKTPGVDVSTRTPSEYRAIKVSADEMVRLFSPDIREQLYKAARSMRPVPALKRVK